MANEEPLYPKPYDFVALAKSVQRGEPPGHDRVRGELLSGRMVFRLRCLRPVQVGSGAVDFVKTKSGEELASLNASVTRSPGGTAPQRVYVIPGSSLKGAVRSALEAVSRSCLRTVGYGTRRWVPSEVAACRRVDSLCPACRIFGMSGAGRDNHQSRVSFEDVLVKRDDLAVARTPLLWQPARGGRLPGIYMENGRLKGRKFYYHGALARGQDPRVVVRSGAELDAAMNFVNLSSGELGLVLIALGCDPNHRFPIKVGGGKPAGLGSVEVEPVSCFLSEDIASAGRMGHFQELKGADLESKMAEWTARAFSQGLVFQEGLEVLQDVWAETRLQEESPEGPY